MEAGSSARATSACTPEPSLQPFPWGLIWTIILQSELWLYLRILRLAGRMAQWVRESLWLSWLNLSSSVGPTWWKERADFLSCSLTCMGGHTQMINVIKEFKEYLCLCKLYVGVQATCILVSLFMCAACLLGCLWIWAGCSNSFPLHLTYCNWSIAAGLTCTTNMVLWRQLSDYSVLNMQCKFRPLHLVCCCS